jgi:cytochrome c-type biogenesis protein CcmH/NrfG
MLKTPPGALADEKMGDTDAPLLRRPLVAAALIVGLGLAVYLPGLDAPFIFDDLPNLVAEETSHVLRLWPWGAPPPLGRCFGTWTFQLNYAIHGHYVPLWRLTNIAIHVAAAWVLFDLVRRTIALPGIPALVKAHQHWFALTAALVWLVHPLQTQSVTYVVQRYESLMGLGYLLTIYCLLRGATSARPVGWYLGSAAACWAGAATKEVAISAPLVAMLYDRAYLEASWRDVLRRRWPLYGGLWASTGWLFYAAVGGMVGNPEDGAGFDQPITPWEYLRSQPAVLLYYLKLVVWPRTLIIDHGWPVETSPWRIYGLGAIVVALFLASAWAVWRYPRVGVVAMAFFLILAPTSSVLPIADLAFEHRMYLPLASVVLLLTGIVAMGVERTVADANRQARVLWLITGVVVGSLLVRTSLRNREYRDPFTIWSQAHANNPLHPRPHLQLAKLYVQAGKVQDAVAICEQALRLPVIDTSTVAGLADAMFRAGRIERAAELYEKVIGIDTQGAFGARMNLARLRMRQKDYQRAIAATRSALERRPSSPLAIEQLAWLLATVPEDELRSGQEALRLMEELPPEAGPLRITRRLSLAAAHAELGQFDEAFRALEPAILLAEKTGNRALLADLRAQAAAYQQHRPWRLEAADR